ncbi:MAG: flagellar hook protein FlgE [Holophagaceae bacterium]|nr:flagellar hook protein FlgE [Holophagaceae bacterium]
MGIASAFYTALSGLSVNSSALTVIGNNLANLNTIGFKGSSTTFQDLFSSNLGASAFQGNGNPSQVGLGAMVGAVMQNFGQSTFQSTSNFMDMAVQGNGFFYMKLVNGGFGHTRSGNFTINQEGFVVDPAGNRLQGYNRTTDGRIDAAYGAVDIKLPIGETIPAVSTKNISFTTNLDASVPVNESKYTTSVQVYDSLGTRHSVMITYEMATRWVDATDSLPITDPDYAAKMLINQPNPNYKPEWLDPPTNSVPNPAWEGEFLPGTATPNPNYIPEWLDPPTNSVPNPAYNPQLIDIPNPLWRDAGYRAIPNTWRYYVWAPDADPTATASLMGTTDPPPATIGSNPPPTVPPDNINLQAPTTRWGIDYFTLAEGTITFASNGAVQSVVAKDIGDTGSTDLQDTLDNPRLQVQWDNGSAAHKYSTISADNTSIVWKLNTGIDNGANAFWLLTQTSTASGTSNSSQDGFGAGTIKSMTVDQNGFIVGTFSNGQTYPVARVAMSIFTNNNGLQKVGENIWKETIASGPANIGTANDVGRGSILGSHLEMSNVDVADEFTRLIITQRGYQANSRIVTTSDEMMQETLALKR